jgi:hypothetical protein
MKIAAIISSLVTVALLVTLVLWLRPLQESPHDRDLRDCSERYGGSRYSEDRAYNAGLVAACMRGRGY